MSNTVEMARDVLHNKVLVYCPVSFQELSFELLDPEDAEAVKGAAECLAESFAGVEVEGTHISEPMTIACKLSKEDMFEFVYGYLAEVCRQNLCYIARDLNTGYIAGALACEDFAPYAGIPVLEGNIAPMNVVLNYLAELDEWLVRTMESRTGGRIAEREYVHAFMGGARLKDKKRFVVIKLFECLIRDAAAKGYKGIIGEATNPRCVKMITEYCGFHQVYDTEGVAIIGEYAKHPVFKNVPREISEECCIMYRPLRPEFDI